jgi:hypothetical protein
MSPYTDQRRHRRAHPRRQVGVGTGGVLGVQAEALAQGEPVLGGARLEVLERGPGGLGVDVVGGDRRDPAPVVDARLEQPRVVRVAEVGRRLDVHLRAHHHPRGGDRGEELVERGLAMAVHRGARLGTEVLDDDLLDVPVAPVHVADGEQRLRALLLGLADADQDAGGEGDAEASRVLDGPQPHRGRLVG